MTSDRKRNDVFKIKETPRGLEFKVFVQPRSSKNQVVGLHGDALKVKLTAPPVGGAANSLCIEYLAKSLGVSKASIEIVHGHTGRNKRIFVHWPSGEPGSAGKKQLKSKIDSLVRNP